MFEHSPSGFQVIPQIFDEDGVNALVDALERETLERSRAGSRHLMKYPVITRAARDPRMVSVAREFLGAEPVPFRATLFDKSSRSNWLIAWHQDTALPMRAQRDVRGWGPWSVKAGIPYAHAPAEALSRVVALRLHVDDSRADNGPLRVLPGTHTLGVLSDADVARVAQHITAVDCLVPAGGVVAMRPLILRASSKAKSDHPRRVLHIEYADSLAIGDGLELAVA